MGEKRAGPGRPHGSGVGCAAEPQNNHRRSDCLRGVLYGGLGNLPGQRRERRGSGPRAPNETVPAHRRRRASCGVGYGMAVLLIAGSVGVSLLASSGRNLAIVMAIYIVLQLGYCFGWKHLPVIDIALVSSGFMLRAMAGGVAAGITLSQWFLLVAAFGSLFMASGKRYAEILLAEKSGAKIRKALEGYTPTYLRFVWTLSATAVVMSYALWGFEMANMVQHHGAVWYQVSMVPFTVAILRYAADVDRGDGGAPDELALSDRTLQILAIAWVGCIAAAVYIAPVVS